jgi:outer membrane receptor for ferrienterochelin and colicin
MHQAPERLIALLAAILLILAGAAGAQDDIRLKDPPKEQSSTLTPTMLHRSSATVSVITGEDLRTLGVPTFTDALRIVPGFEVAKISASESGVSVRSYTGPAAASQGILALIDGRQVYNEFFGGVFWESLPVTLDEIKAIEVIRGPGSFLHGPNAMHGFVNFITKTPLDYEEGMTAGHEVFLSAAGGSHRANTESMTFVRREGNSGFKATVAHDDIDEFDGGNTRDKYWADLRLRSRLDEGHVIDVAGGVSRSRFNVLFPRIFLAPPPEPPLPTATYDTKAQEGYLRATYLMGNDLILKANWNHFGADGMPSAVYVPFVVVVDTADVDLQYSLAPLPGNRITLGTGYRFATFDTRDADVSDGRHATHLGWVFVQDEWALGSQFFVTGGARVDVHSEAGTSVAPRLALVWEFDPAEGGPFPSPEAGQSLRATVGYGYRNPSLRDLWFDMTLQVSPNPTITGNRDLKPEMMRSFEVGYWGRPTDRLQAECSVYYNLGDRLVAFQGNAGPPLTASRQNFNKEDAYGLEASVEYQLTGDLYTFANYAYEIRRDRETHQRISDGPRHKANAGVRAVQEAHLSGMLWVTLFDSVEFIDKSTRGRLGGVPSYTLVNAKLWYPFHLGKADGRVFLQGFNILDRVHREHPEGDEYGLLAMAGVELAW